MKHQIKYLCIIAAFNVFSLYPVTFVYNLKIALSTRLGSIKLENACPSLIAFTLIQQWKEKYNNTKQTAGGGLGTLVTNHGPWYFEIDWAAAKVKQGTFSRIQTDDVLFTTGYSHEFSKTNRGSVSFLLGIPTHKDTIFEPIEMGINHVGLGLQLDDSWTYSRNGVNYLFTAFRYIRFLPRIAINCVNGKKIEYDLNLGNSVDLLVAHASNWGKHKLEFGYNPTFTFGATICPSLPALTHAASGIRNAFYANYRYAFFIAKQQPAGFIIGTSYGFDSIPKDVGFKGIYTLWATFALCF